MVESHPRSSIFHTREWLDALQRTYKYKPRAFTTSAPGSALSNGIVFCQVNSRLTGSRLVSLPFSDHCDPLVESPEDLQALLSAVRERTAGKFSHVEIRPRSISLGEQSNFKARSQYHLHVLDLHLSLEEVYSGLHKNGMQRKIRRAERERVVADQGRSESMLQEFYGLILMTHRRHKVPPQPLAWFRNVIKCCDSRVKIYVARVDNRPIASIFTLRHKKSLVYKYGGSDESFHNLGAMPRLFWAAIQDAKSEQLLELDLGRSDQDNEGLMRFKDHLGAARSPLQYWSSGASARVTSKGLAFRTAKHFLTRLPDSLFRLVGELLYRHAG
ncbi:MAG: hypothetical protein DMG97_39575 [Acidobacteria bacterium]|nr:MAG: hypothetical protein DMG97_39575 [Acidobacteriota bacterium]